MNLIIFDIDGTLVDSQNLIVAAQREAFAALHLTPPSRERSLSIVGLSLKEAFTSLVGQKGPVEELAAVYRQAVQRMRADPAEAEPLFPGAAEVVTLLSRREDVVLGIATGKPRRGVAHLLRQLGWEHLFATVQTADDAPSKPDPTMLHQAMAQVGVAPQQTTMIGDTSFDMAMARAAGVGAIGVSWGYHPVAALREAGAQLILERFDQLPDALGLEAMPALA